MNSRVGPKEAFPGTFLPGFPVGFSCAVFPTVVVCTRVHPSRELASGTEPTVFTAARGSVLPLCLLELRADTQDTVLRAQTATLHALL